jgi:hypothetical protein
MKYDLIYFGAILYILAQGTFHWWLVLLAIPCVGTGLTVSSK